MSNPSFHLAAENQHLASTREPDCTPPLLEPRFSDTLPEGAFVELMVTADSGQWFETTSRPTWLDRVERWWDRHFLHVCVGMYLGVYAFCLAAMCWPFVARVLGGPRQ